MYRGRGQSRVTFAGGSRLSDLNKGSKQHDELRRIGGRYGLATMRTGGGQGIAMVIEASR